MRYLNRITALILGQFKVRNLLVLPRCHKWTPGLKILNASHSLAMLNIYKLKRKAVPLNDETASRTACHLSANEDRPIACVRAACPVNCTIDNRLRSRCGNWSVKHETFSEWTVSGHNKDTAWPASLRSLAALQLHKIYLHLEKFW